MTKAEAIAILQQLEQNAEERKLWWDAQGEKEIGWREFTYANGLRDALEILEEIEKL